jgi:DNA-binding transcriptional MerR regulator
VRFFTPAEASENTGVSLDTLRYYERVGLLPEVERTTAGWRRFSEIDLKWLGLVRCLRDTGMPIAEIQRFTSLMRGEGTADERIAVLEIQERRVEEQLARLAEHLAQIRGKIAHYRTGEIWSPTVGSRQ